MPDNEDFLQGEQENQAEILSPELNALGGEEAETKIEEPNADEEARKELEAYREFVESKGGQTKLQEADELYNKVFTPDPAQFDPSSFWDHLADVAPSRYDALANDLFRSHAQDALRINGIDPASYKDYLEWEKAGRPSPHVAQEVEIDTSDLDPDDPKDRYILKAIEMEKRERERQKADQAAFEEKKRQQEIAQAQAVNKTVEDYSTARSEHVKRKIDALNLGDDDLAKRLKNYIRWSAEGEFRFNSPHAKTLMRAFDHIRYGETRLAANLEGEIDKMLGATTNQVARDLVELLSAKRELDKLKLQNAGARRELPPTGASLPATGKANAATAKPFDNAAQIAKLRDLERIGKFN